MLFKCYLNGILRHLHAPPPHTSGRGSSCTFYPSTTPLFKGICCAVPTDTTWANTAHPSWMASQECPGVPGEILGVSSRTNLGLDPALAQFLNQEFLPGTSTSHNDTTGHKPHLFLAEKRDLTPFPPKSFKTQGCSSTTRCKWKRTHPKGEVGRGFWNKKRRAAMNQQG